jgi:hypothetical protein
MGDFVVQMPSAGDCCPSDGPTKPTQKTKIHTTLILVFEFIYLVFLDLNWRNIKRESKYGLTWFKVI